MYSGTDTPELRAQLGAAAEASAARLPFVIHIIGPQGSGKTTFAAALAAELGVTWADTSDYLMRELAAKLVTQYGVDFERTLKSIQTKTPGIRRTLLNYGDDRTAESPACLIAGAVAKGCIITGARRKIEMEAWFHGETLRADDVIVELVREPGTPEDDSFELAGWKPMRKGIKYTIHQCDADGRARSVQFVASETRRFLAEHI